MVDLEFPGRRWSARLFWLLCLLGTAVVSAQPAANSTAWQVNFASPAPGNPYESVAVPIGNDSISVVVVAPGANPTMPVLANDPASTSVRMIGYDPVSRLGFVKIDSTAPQAGVRWSDDIGAGAVGALRSLQNGETVKCRGAGWVKQVAGKILPLALLKVEFTGAVPLPGTPLVDEAGRVVGLVFQSSGAGTTGYAIPAEAIHRVRKDICGGGRLVRGWLGLALRAESQSPQISRVLPDSPAAQAGIKANDVLSVIGSRPVADYADAANAFFYLVPGEAVRVKLLREGQQLEFTLTPLVPGG